MEYFFANDRYQKAYKSLKAVEKMMNEAEDQFISFFEIRNILLDELGECQYSLQGIFERRSKIMENTKKWDLEDIARDIEYKIDNAKKLLNRTNLKEDTRLSKVKAIYELEAQLKKVNEQLQEDEEKRTKACSDAEDVIEALQKKHGMKFNLNFFKNSIQRKSDYMTIF